MVKPGVQTVDLPQKKHQVLIPFVVTVIVSAIDILAAFIDLIIKNSTTVAVLSESKGVLSASVIQFHMTWGIMLSITLSFVENSLRWTLNRRGCSAFAVFNGIICFLFMVCCIYTWLWANDAAGMTFICKYLLQSVNVRKSPEQIRQISYTGNIKLAIDLGVCWLLPLQCVIVLIDSFTAFCAKPKRSEIGINTMVRGDHVFVSVDKDTMYEILTQKNQSSKKKGASREAVTGQ